METKCFLIFLIEMFNLEQWLLEFRMLFALEVTDSCKLFKTLWNSESNLIFQFSKKI